MHDESPKSEVFDLDVNEVDFLGVENILSNSLKVKVFGDFYVENNFISKRKETIDSFWEIFMVHERENMYDCRVKPKFFEYSVKSFQVDSRSLVVISEVLLIVGCYIVLLLKRKGWKELIGLSKDRGKNHLNLRTNSLQLGENDASQFYLFWLNSHLTSFTKNVISERQEPSEFEDEFSPTR